MIMPSPEIMPPRTIPLALLILIVPALLALLVVITMGKISARKAEKLTGTKPSKWLLLVISFVLGLILYLALADLGRVILKYQLADKSWVISSYDQLIKNISARMVVILLDFPLLAWIWHQATAKPEEETQTKAEVLARKYFLRFEIFVFGAVLILPLGICLYHLFNWALGVSEIEWASFSAPLSYGLTALVLLTIKILGLTSTKKGKSSI